MCLRISAFSFILTILLVIPVSSEIMLIGIDEKMDFINDETVMNPPGSDKILIFDISATAEPRLKGTLSLMNSVYGPPTNLIITYDETLGLVANSMNWVEQNGQWTAVPDNSLYLIDLEGTPRLIDTITVGSQPSGLDITPDSRLLIIGNRAESTVTVVAIKGKTAQVTATVEVSAPVDAVAVTPDGNRAVFTMRTNNKVGFLHIDGETVTYNPNEDITVGIEPYNVAVSPLGTVALVNNTGPTGGNDGHVDAVTVIDLTAEHPYVSDWIGVGDGPEGLAFSPDGMFAVSVLINGSQSPNTEWAAHENGIIVLLAVNGTSVRKLCEIEVGAMPEGVVFSNDSRYLYVGNFISDDMTVLRIDGETVTAVTTIELPGSPASMRGSQ